MIFYYGKDKSLVVPHYLGLFLQGFQEGGCITTIGLYFGDRLFNYKYAWLYHAFLIYMVINMSYKQTNNKSNSS